MKYIDLHCDALTKEGVSSVTKENLLAGGCMLQCFAAFVREREGRFLRALSLVDAFDSLCKREGYSVFRGKREEGICAMLTVEEGGAVEGSLEKQRILHRKGVRMMTLVWNRENELGFPNFDRTAPQRRETERGLKPFGKEAVEEMISLGMLADVSHGSDRLLKDVAMICRGRAPFVASHSGAAEVYPHARNLTDEGIRLIAEGGGVVGLDFCADFASDDHTAEGQERALLAHAEHILRVGGEDVLALGSDFDGIPENPYLRSPADLPRFLEELSERFGAKTAEKIACKNALRVFTGV